MKDPFEATSADAAIEMHEASRQHGQRRADNLHPQVPNVGRSDRERLNGHLGRVIWFTGLSGSGKSTLANALEQHLHAKGIRTYVLDGDNIRQDLNKDLGFAVADRIENIRQVAEVTQLMMDRGLIVMMAFISPFYRERKMACEFIGSRHFFQVFVDASLAECEQRVPKGLYKKARSGHPPYDWNPQPLRAPLHPNCVIDTQQLPQEAALAQLLYQLDPMPPSLTEVMA